VGRLERAPVSAARGHRRTPRPTHTHAQNTPPFFLPALHRAA
jgi:hypothetical protein